MAFIRTKRIPPKNGQLYYYLVESYRDHENGGRVRQRVLKYMGNARPTQGDIDKALKEIKEKRG